MVHGAVAGTMAQICMLVRVTGPEGVCGNGGRLFIDWRFFLSWSM